MSEEEELEEQLNKTVSVKFILSMLEDLDRRRDIQKDIEPITGYYSKRAMLKKILKEAGFDYKQYKIKNGG